MKTKILENFESKKDLVRKSFSKSVPRTLYDFIQRSLHTLEFIDSSWLIDCYSGPQANCISYIVPSSTSEDQIYYIFLKLNGPLYESFIKAIDNPNKDEQLDDLMNLSCQIVQKLKRMT